MHEKSHSDLLKLWRSIEDPDFHASENAANPEPRLYNFAIGNQLMEKKLPLRTDVLGDGAISLGQLTTIIGQGGTGKSRVAMQVAISQVVGWPFAGLKTHPEPLRHLLLGTENSIHRQQADYLKMTSTLAPEQQSLVDSRIHFHVVQEVDDAFISLASDDIRRKWLDTIEATQPDCIFIDPYGEVHVGDINSDADVRHTLRELACISRRHNPDTAIVIVHHGRTGRHNIAQAIGWDKSNFSLGSKALYSGTRCQINIAPADPDDHSRIVMSCGKANDAKPFDPVGLKLDEPTMLYRLDPTFNLQAWKDDVEGKRSTANFTLAEIAEALADGPKKAAQIHQELGGQEAGSLRSLQRILLKGKEESYFRFGNDGYKLTKKGDRNSPIICTPSTTCTKPPTLSPTRRPDPSQTPVSPTPTPPLYRGVSVGTGHPQNLKSPPTWPPTFHLSTTSM